MTLTPGLQLPHYIGDKLLGVIEALGDDLDVHGRLAGLARTLAINPVLAHQNQRIGEEIQCDREAAAFHSHHEFVFIQLFAALVVHRHALSLSPGAKAKLTYSIVPRPYQDGENLRDFIRDAGGSGAGGAAGFKPGTIIQQLDGTAISQPGQFTAGIARHLGGDTVSVRVIRRAEVLTLSVVLKARPRETSPYAEVMYTSVVVRGTKRSVLITRPRREGRLPAIVLMQGLGCYSVDNLDRANGYGRIIGEFEKAGFGTMRVEKAGEADSEDPACEDPASKPDLEAAGT